MSDLLTTNVKEQNPAARRPIWWVHYMFGQMSGEYVDITTDLTEDFCSNLRNAIERYASLGLKVQITEMER